MRSVTDSSAAFDGPMMLRQTILRANVLQYHIAEDVRGIGEGKTDPV